MQKFLITLFSIQLLFFSVSCVRYHRMSTLFNTHKLRNHFANKNKFKDALNNPKQQIGFKLGEQLMQSLDNYRKSSLQIKSNIKQSDRMKEIAYELVGLLQINSDKFDTHTEFLKRAKMFTDNCYYTELVAKVADKSQFPDKVIKMWSEKSAKSKRDLLLKYDEGAAYCTYHSTGFLCATTLLILPDKRNPQKNLLIQKLKEM